MRRLVVFILIISSIFVYTHVDAQEDQKIELLISFKSKTNKELIKDSGGKVKTELKNFPIIIAEVPRGALKSLLKNKDIEFIEEDGFGQPVLKL